MIEIYLGSPSEVTDKNELKRFVINTDDYFNGRFCGKIEVTPKMASIIQRIEKAPYLGDWRFASRMNHSVAISLTELSTGCKTALCCIAFSAPKSCAERDANMIFPGIACGNNALLEVFQLDYANLYFPLYLPRLEQDIKKQFRVTIIETGDAFQSESYQDLCKEVDEWLS